MKCSSKSITFYTDFHRQIPSTSTTLHFMTFFLQNTVTWLMLPSFISILISAYAFNSYIKLIGSNCVPHESKWCTLVSHVICLKGLFWRRHFLKDYFRRKAEQWNGSSYLRDSLDLRVFKRKAVVKRERGCQGKRHIHCQSLHFLL